MTRRELLCTHRDVASELWRWPVFCRARKPDPLAPQDRARTPAKAKSVIYLFMHGGVSHVDTFDPKPQLTRHSGKPLSAELAKTIKTSFIHDPTQGHPARQPLGIPARRHLRHAGLRPLSARARIAWTTSP